MERRRGFIPGQDAALSTEILVSEAAAPSYRNWTVACIGLLLVQAACALRWPQEGWPTATGLTIQMLLAAAFSFRLLRASPAQSRSKLALCVCAFLLWAMAYVSILWGEYALRFVPNGAWVTHLFLGLRSLPFLLALCWSPEETTPAEQWLDVVQTILIGILLFLFLFPGLSVRDSAAVPPLRDVLSMLFLDFNNLLLLGVALIVTASSHRRHERTLHRSLAVLFLVTVLSAAFANHVLIQRWTSPSGSIWFLTANLSALAFLLSSAVPSSPATSRRALYLRGEARRVLQLGSPIVFSLTGFLFSVAIATGSRYRGVGILLGIANLCLYAVRNARTQMRYETLRRELERANVALHDLSERDALTGIHNRRRFSQALNKAWQPSDTTSFPLSLLLIDVDYFKRYNDTLGHIRGDECLVTVAEILSSKLKRTSDVVSRYGGEEFAVILAQTDSQGARLVADRLCQGVRQANMQHPSSPFGVVTVSVGVSTFASDAPEHLLPGTHASEMMILLADAALYEAKRLGRNRTHSIHTT